MSPGAPDEALARVVASALAEDLGDLGDVTTTSIVPAGTPMTGVIRSREAGRIAGVGAIRHVLSRLPEPASATVVAADGADVAALTSTIDGRRVTGARVVTRAGGDEQEAIPWPRVAEEARGEATRADERRARSARAHRGRDVDHDGHRLAL